MLSRSKCVAKPTSSSMLLIPMRRIGVYHLCLPRLTVHLTPPPSLTCPPPPQPQDGHQGTPGNTGPAFLYLGPLLDLRSRPRVKVLRANDILLCPTPPVAPGLRNTPRLGLRPMPGSNPIGSGQERSHPWQMERKMTDLPHS